MEGRIEDRQKEEREEGRDEEKEGGESLTHMHGHPLTMPTL